MVGKSSLTYRFINYNAPEEHDPTIEDKFMTVLDLDGRSVTCNVLDTAGQDDYQGLIDSWIDGGDGFLLVFALNDRDSFNDLDKKKSKIDMVKKKKNYPLILVGNKSDLTDRAIGRKEAEDKAKLWNAAYFETSAKNDENCHAPFIECTKRLLNNDVKTKNSIPEESSCCSCIIF